MPGHLSVQPIETASPVSSFFTLRIPIPVRAKKGARGLPSRGVSSFEIADFFRTDYREPDKNATGREPGAPVRNRAVRLFSVTHGSLRQRPATVW